MDRLDSSIGKPAPAGLHDQFGRRITYLRLSITDRCDFRCGYCMAEKMAFQPKSSILTLEECARLVRVFVGLGVTKVRITGGEPLVRHDAIGLLENLGRIEGIRELVLTTNGSRLAHHASALRAAGVARINVNRYREAPGGCPKVWHGDSVTPVVAGGSRPPGSTRGRLAPVIHRAR